MLLTMRSAYVCVLCSMICRAGALTLDSASHNNHCLSFLILTRQRSGSSWLCDQLNKRYQHKSVPFHVGHEGFNLADGFLGGEVARQLIASGEAVSNEQTIHRGPKKFAHRVFDHLAQDLTPPCLVGFFMMGAYDDVFFHKETLPLLEQTSIRKVLLKRENTTEQWISHETSCWFGDWNGKGTSDHVGHLKEARERLQRGETCDGQNLETFQRKKDEQYNEWKSMLGDQNVTEISTEQLDRQINDLVSNLLDEVEVSAGGKEPNVQFDAFDILTDDA